MDLLTLLNNLRDDGSLAYIANNPVAQFGRGRKNYLGATLLPERMVMENSYTEEAIRYRTVIANAGTRYSPAQLKNGELLGSFQVVLGHSDIARQLDGRQYDALLRYLMQAVGAVSMEAIANITNWLDTVINTALIETLEKERWEAIVAASVVRTGDNGFKETVAFSNPANHRTAASAPWSTDTTDIFADIQLKADLLESKGYTVSRMFCSRTVLAIMANNDTVKTRVGVSVINSSGQITGAAGRASHDAINSALMADGLPPIELYGLQYRTDAGTTPFLPTDAFVLVGTTDNDETLDRGDDEIMFLENTIGYTAIGKGAGQPVPGRVITAVAKMDKPPRIEAEGWQTAFPVITEPEAICVINSIA